MHYVCFLSGLNEISGGCEKIAPVSGSFWSNFIKFFEIMLLTAWSKVHEALSFKTVVDLSFSD